MKRALSVTEKAICFQFLYLFIEGMKHLIEREEPDGIQISSFTIAWVRKYGFKYGLPTQPHSPELR